MAVIRRTERSADRARRNPLRMESREPAGAGGVDGDHVEFVPGRSVNHQEARLEAARGDARLGEYVLATELDRLVAAQPHWPEAAYRAAVAQRGEGDLALE